jgi:predicted RNase H-like HicB family nuclease
MSVKLVVEKHADGYVAYPVGMRGVVVGQGDTYDDAVADVTSAIRFHIETFGREVLDDASPVSSRWRAWRSRRSTSPF